MFCHIHTHSAKLVKSVVFEIKRLATNACIRLLNLNRPGAWVKKKNKLHSTSIQHCTPTSLQNIILGPKATLDPPTKTPQDRVSFPVEHEHKAEREGLGL